MSNSFDWLTRLFYSFANHDILLINAQQNFNSYFKKKKLVLSKKVLKTSNFIFVSILAKNIFFG